MLIKLTKIALFIQAGVEREDGQLLILMLI